MNRIWAERARIGGCWRRHVCLTIASSGVVADIAFDQPKEPLAVGVLVPAPVNCHSHGFQRLLAGLTEKKQSGEDSFWTWRQQMFHFLQSLTPEQLEAVTAYAQMEMLETGFAACAEFHYLHHQPDGRPYQRLAEMSERVAAAARTSGIGLTLLPVQYEHGGCDRRPLGAGQVRFGTNPEQYMRLLEQAGQAVRRLPADSRLGVAPHSLRAVSQESLRRAAQLTSGPLHLHLAEQLPEVTEVQAHWGARPVEWVLDNLDLSARWCLIHCTQMQPDETMRLAVTGAVAGLCPLTEANLGDGIFDGVRWLGANAAIAVGTDSNIRVSLPEELRQLETSQRLRDRKRACLATADRATGLSLLEEVACGGATATQRRSGHIAVGNWADLLALDDTHPDLEGLAAETMVDVFIFAGSQAMVKHVWSAGRHLVKDGQHINRGPITAAYRTARRALTRGL